VISVIARLRVATVVITIDAIGMTIVKIDCTKPSSPRSPSASPNKNAAPA